MDDHSLAQVSAIVEKVRSDFSETKHSIHNSVAVIMAQAEMSQQNPARYPRLAESVLERGQEIVDRLAVFSEKLETLRKSIQQP